jgi:hypothetical protein
LIFDITTPTSHPSLLHTRKGSNGANARQSRKEKISPITPKGMFIRTSSFGTIELILTDSYLLLARGEQGE